MIPTFYRKSFDIAGYTFQAANHCPACILNHWGNVLHTNAEEALDASAREEGIDRMDEYSFDSGDFPKVIFVDQIEDGETCDTCGGEL